MQNQKKKTTLIYPATVIENRGKFNCALYWTNYTNIHPPRREKGCDVYSRVKPYELNHMGNLMQLKTLTVCKRKWLHNSVIFTTGHWEASVHQPLSNRPQSCILISSIHAAFPTHLMSLTIFGEWGLHVEHQHKVSCSATGNPTVDTFHIRVQTEGDLVYKVTVFTPTWNKISALVRPDSDWKELYLQCKIIRQFKRWWLTEICSQTFRPYMMHAATNVTALIQLEISYSMSRFLPP
jgi:hypothetical protein